jgi:hypothetical protein
LKRYFAAFMAAFLFLATLPSVGAMNWTFTDNVIVQENITADNITNTGYGGTLRAADVITKGPWLDVRAFAPAGTLADGTVDWTSYIQAAINALDNGSTLVFPKGTYVVSSGLNINYKVGIQIVGLAPGKGDGRTKIVWSGNGDEGGTLITGVGSRSVKIYGFYFAGNNTESTDAGNRTGMGLYLYGDATGNSSMWSVENCEFRYFNTGIQVGHLTNVTQNNEDHVFREIGIYYCNTGYRQLWANSLNIAMYSSYAGFCDNGFVFGSGTQQAGSLDMYNMDIGHNSTDIYFANSCRLGIYGIRTEGSGEFIRSGAGSNAASVLYVAGGIISNDAQAGTYFVTFNNGNATFMACEFGSSTSDPLLFYSDVYAGRLNFVGCTFNSQEMVQTAYTATNYSMVTYSGCSMWDRTLSYYVPIPDDVRLAKSAAGSTYNFADNDATPSVVGNKWFVVGNSGTTEIIAFDNGYVGQEITLIFSNDNTTIKANASGIYPAGGIDVTPTAGQIMKFICVDGIYGTIKWLEVSRSF